MYLGLMQLQFDEIKFLPGDLKFLSSVCLKLQKRFKVHAKVHRGTEAKITIIQLNRRKEDLASCFDKISHFCEQEGIGRVEVERILIDDVEAILRETY